MGGYWGAFLACFWLPHRKIASGTLAAALNPIFFYFCPGGHGPAGDGLLGFGLFGAIPQQAEPLIALNGDVFGARVAAGRWRGRTWLGLAVFTVRCLSEGALNGWFCSG